MYADIHIDDGNITCDDNDNNNNNDDDENNDDNDDNQEDEQQQQQQGTEVRMDFNMPNTDFNMLTLFVMEISIIQFIVYHVLKASLLVCLLMLKQRKWHFPVCFLMVSMVF